MDDKTLKNSPAAIAHPYFFRIIFKQNAFLQIGVHNLYYQRQDFLKKYFSTLSCGIDPGTMFS